MTNSPTSSLDRQRTRAAAAVGRVPAGLAMVLLASHTAASSALRQQVRDQPTAPQPEAWGEPVEGVQLRLAVARNTSPYLPGQLSSFEVQLRNQSTGPASYGAEAIMLGNLEIDGVWYAQVHAGSCCSGQQEIAAGQDSDVMPLRVIQTNLFTLNTSPTGALALSAGRHSVRVRSVSNDLYGVRTSVRPGLVLVSNPVAIDIPYLSSAAERQALVDQTSPGESTGLPAARMLVEKYPDAALGAIQAAVNATRDAGLRSEYVRVAGMLPGDAPVAFLQSQLAPDAGLLSQVTAAEALLARGRFDGLSPLVEAWRRVLPRVPARFPDQNAEALLIHFLAHSGDPDAIDALERDAEAPIDVRVAVVQAFLPPPVTAGHRTQASTGPGLSVVGYTPMTTLPDGPAGAAIDRLLGLALDDRGQRIGLKGTFDDVSYEDPRVCDMAAFVLATRWPQQYRFTWPKAIAARNAEIEVIRRARQARDGR